MNKILKGLLVAALAASSATVNAKHTNKTFLMPRPVGVNLPMEYTAFVELINRQYDDSFGGSFQATGFYQASTNGEDLAKYFLFNNKSTITLNKVGQATVPTSTVQDLDLGYIIHDNDSTSDYSATVSLDPKQTAWGIRFDYHQDLCKILKGLYLHASLPIVHVENDPGLTIVASGNFPENTVAPAPGTPAIKTVLEQYFRGDFENLATNGNRQAKLTHAKIAGKQSETGVADIDLALGYKFLDGCNYFAALALAITIPTGNEADGVFLWQPIVGNGKHFGLGGDLCAQACIWGDMDHNIKINLKMKYRYLFENSDKRTLGIKDRNWGQYHLLGTIDAASGAQLTPAANITTLNVDATPGSQFDGIIGFAYNNCGFCFDLGYNMFFKEAESVKLKDAFKDNQNVIVARSFDTDNTDGVDITAPTTVDNATEAVPAPITSLVNIDNLDIKAAETPSQFTHAIYGSLGYIFSEWENPFMLAVGGKYEVSSKNSALEQWGVWAKAGIGF